MGVMDRYNEKKKKEEEKKTSSSTMGVLERYELNKYYNSFNTDSVNDDYINTFISDVNNFFKGAEDTYKGIVWGNASSVYDSTNNSWEELKKRRETINAWLYKNKSNISEDSYKSLYDSINSIDTNASSLLEAFEGAKNYYGKFETEDAYKLEEGKKSYDLNAGKLEIEELEKKASERESLKSKINSLNGQQAQYYSQRNTAKAAEIGKQIKELQAQYDAIGDIEGKLAEKRTYYRDAERIQTSSKLYDGAMKAVDFEEYSKKGEAIENPSAWDAQKGLSIAGWRPFAEDVNNVATFARDADYTQLIETEWYKYTFMTDDEVKVYNYYLGKGDKDSADRYLSSIEESLKQRWAGQIAKNTEESNLEWFMAINAGLDQWATGVKGTWNAITGDESITDPTAIQYASGMVRENIESDFWRGAYDLGVTMSNQLPSILVGAVTGQVGGLATMGVSVYGNAYTEMINLGYNKEQANSYATLTTAAELGLQNILGGYKVLGGKLSGGVTEFFASKVDNALAKLAIRGVGSMLGEGIEESLQSVLEPTFKSYVTGETYDVDWSEVLYSGILGALSAGVLEGVPSVIGAGIDAQNTYKAGKEFKKFGDIEKLNKFSADTVAHKLAGKVDEKTSAYKIGQLLREVDATISEQNKSDITKSLTRKGIQPKDAERYVKALSAVVEGYTLSSEQINALNAHPELQKTLVDVIINPNSTVNQRMQGYAEAVKMVKKPNSNAETAQNGTNVPQTGIVSDESGTAENTAKIDVFSYSDDGKTYIKEKNEEVSVKEVYKKDGVAFARLEDGREVEAKEIDFGSEEEALMYEMVADLGVTPDVATAMMDSYNKGKGTISPEDFRADGELAYKYGLVGYSKGLNKLNLTDKQKGDLFLLGAKQANKNAETLDTARKNGFAKQRSLKFDGEQTKKNGVTYIGVNPESVTKDVQKASLIGAEILANASNLDIVVYESYRDKNGRLVVKIDGKVVPAPNGMFREGNRIYLDINAGAIGQEGTILYTLSHEVGHYIRQWNPKAFKELGDFLFENYEGEIPVKTLIDNEIAGLKRQYEAEGKKIPSDSVLYDMAYEDVVCNALSKMFADESAYIKLAELKKQNQSLWAKIGEAIKAFLDKLKKAIGIYSKYDLTDRNAAMTKDMATETYNKLQDMYIKAFVEADANYAKQSNSDAKFVENYVETNSTKYNLKYAEEHIKDIKKNYNPKQSKVSLDRLLAEYNKVIDIWKKLGGEIDSKFLKEWNEKGKDKAFSVFKAQAGYKYNIELSSMCKKGVPLFEAIDSIVKKEVMKEIELNVLGKAEKEILYDILKGHHFEIPCAICYVEQARQREGAIIDAFVNGKVERDKNDNITYFKLGWNEVLQSVQDEMKKNGVDYTFPAVDRKIATDGYIAKDITMDEATETAFYNALKKEANKEIARYNEERKTDKKYKPKKLIKNVTPSEIKDVFKGKLSENLMLFKVLFQNPSSRFRLENDLLYSSMTTLNLAKAHNDLYVLFNAQSGVAGYKSKQAPIVYWGDILGKKWDSSTVRNEGGIRNQSNSDFQMFTFLDQVQMYIDFTAKGYYLQAYTKVLAELKLFGLSRGKINASLIPAVYVYKNADGTIDVETTKENAGLDKNGNPLYDDVEGINHTEAFMLIEDAQYSKSIGGICIGYSDKHILKLLNDKRVGQIIGFHDKTDDPTKRYRGAIYAKNYNGLNEAVNSEGKTVHLGFNNYVRKAEKMFKFNEATETFEGTVDYNGKKYVADDIPKLAADLYLEMCKDKGYTPAYNDFAFHENYYKLLSDFSMYDSQGHYAPHRKVSFNLPSKVPYLDLNGKKQYMPSEAYIKAELEKELKVRDSISESLADTSEEGIIPQFKARVQELHNAKTEIEDANADTDTHYSTRVTDKETLDFLENQEHITTYKSFVEIDGKLYSPMATKVKGDDGKYKLTNPSELGVWQQAEEKPDTIPKFHKSGYGYYVLKKDDGGTVTAAYNPYEHSSNLVLNDQFEAAYQRPNLVTVECIIPKSELTSGYKAKYAKDSTGYLDWKSGSVAGKLKGNKRKVYLSRWLKPVRIVPDSEVAKMYKDLVGTEISVPFNVVTPNLLSELENIGVKIDYNGSAGYQYRQTKTENSNVKYSTRDSEGNTFERAKEYFGTTTDFEEAGFILPNGEMLKLTDDNHRGERQYDHRAIGIVYGEKVDLNVNHGFNFESNKQLEDFVRNGGIRFDAGSFDLDMDAGMQLSDKIPLTAAQERTIRNFIEWKKKQAETYKPDEDDFSLYKGSYTIHVDFGADADYALSASTKERDAWAIKHLSYEGGQINADRIISDIRHYYQTGETRQPSLAAQFHTMYSTRDFAPTFYSQMGKVVEGMKQDKFAANSIVPMLRGRGVKAEEIRWSGIVTYLEGKKSVTKQELLEFIAGSQLQIGEQMSGTDTFIADDDNIYESEKAFKDAAYAIAEEKGIARDRVRFNINTDILYAYAFVLNTNEALLTADIEESGASPKWSQYKLDGGTNYREIVFTMPNSSYTNRAMKGHWGQDAEGVLVHARIQDFDVKGKNMLFIEEIQSDWHNEGHSKGYSNKEYEDAVESHDKLYNEYKKLDLAFHKYVRSNEFMTDPEDVRKKKHDWLRGKAETAQKKYLDAEKVVNSLKEKGAGDTPDAPFKDTYHEYVLKRLLRMAAEQGYDSIGWTPAWIQEERWSEDYAEGYRIEYDQDMPKFLKKYGRQWGAKVDKTYIKANNHKEELVAERIAESQKQLAFYEEDIKQYDPNSEDAEFDRKAIENLKQLLEDLKGTKVWSMGITDSMKDSVLYEGQTMYSTRDFASQVDAVLSGADTTNTHLKLMDTPKLLQKAGLPNLPVLMTAKHLKTITSDSGDSKANYHGLSVDIVKKLPEYISDPVMIADSLTRNDSVVIITEAIDSENRPVIAAILLNGQGRLGGKHINANIMTSAYGKDNFQSFLDRIAENNAVIYWNKKKSQDMSVSLGVQFSNAVTSLNSNTIIRQAKAFVKQNSKNSEDFQKYSVRDPEDQSNRSLLANALESVAQNDIEKNKLAQYKEKIKLINSEEQKLQEINEQLKELYFTKGKRDAEKIRNLKFDQKQTENRINTYDRQLLNLEASKPLRDVLEREKKLAYKKAVQKGKEELAAYREKSAKNTRELLNRWQESRKKGVESRHKTAYREEIKKVVSKLNELLLRPTKDKHVKEELKNAVADALLIINMDTVGAEERVAKYNKWIASETDPDKIAELTKTRDRIELQGDNLKDKLTALQSAYEKVKNSTDPELKNAYQEPVMNAIKNVSELVGNTPLRDMNLTQLEAVYEMYSMVLHTVRTANKAFKAKKGETITQIAEAVNDEVRKVGKEKFKRNPIIAGLRKIGWTLLKPFTAFRTIGSDTFTGLYNNLRNGEDSYYLDVNEAKNFIQAQYQKHNFKSWDLKETKTFTAKSGKTFTLTLEQMMSLYAYSRREQAHDHIIEGGIVLEDSVIETKNKLGLPVKYTVDTKTAFNISEETLDEICNSLTTEQKGFVEEMQAYLSDVMGAKGNEVSMELLGVALFKEKFYFPLKSSSYYMGFKPEEAGEIKLKNSSFSKETVRHANNPVVLQNFTDVWATHVNDMSMYHAFVLPLEDFTRVFNYKTKTAENLETMSTEATIANVFGEGATKYIRNFLKSLNGGVRSESVGAADKLTSLAKKGAVLGSASVMIQQPSAIMRAMALINPVYFVTSTHKSINLIKHNKDWAELKQYAPIAGIKEMGRFDVGMGQTTVKWIKDQNTILEKADEIMSKAPAFMDEVTWVGIWNAVKNEIKHKNKDLQVGSEEYLKKCGERFTEVISLTQVYDSVFSRSDIMRNQSWIAKALTAFMAEPTTTLNMVIDSFIQGKRTGSVGKFLGKTAGTTGAIVGSIVLNSALKSIITAMRDDDEDESYAEKYIGSFVGNTLDNINPLTYIPVVKDIWSIFQGYDVGRMDMDLFADLQKAIEAMDSENKSEYEKWAGLTGAISAFFGIPFKNVERDIRGAINTIKSFINGEKTTSMGIENAIMEGLTGEEKTNAEQLYEAMLRGDQEQIKRVKARFKDGDTLKAAIRSAFKKHYLEGDLDYDTTLRYLVEYGEMDEDEAYWKLREWDYEIEHGDTEDYAKYNNFYTAVESGKNLKAVIKEYTDNGVEKTTLASQITSHFKPLYKEMSNYDRAKIKGYLLNAYALLGYDRNKKSKDIDKWLED